MSETERLRRLEDRLWKTADQLPANSKLRASDYSTPVLGRMADGVIGTHYAIGTVSSTSMRSECRLDWNMATVMSWAAAIDGGSSPRPPAV